MKYIMKSMATIGLVSILVLFAVSVAPAMAQLTPPTPYVMNGYVFYENGTECNGPVVNVMNLNTDTEWQAETNASSHYYELVLANGTDVNVSEVLQFNAKDTAETQFDTTEHAITQDEMDNGGLFDFNITLHPPPAPDLVITDVSCTLFKIGKRANVYAISYNITNIGNEKAGRSVSNLTVDGNVTKKKDRIDALAPGGTLNRVIKYRSVAMPNTILVCADCKCKIDESNETNNCGTWMSSS